MNVSSSVLQLTGTVLSQNPGIPISWCNPVSYVQVIGRNNISSVLPDPMPYLGLGPDNLGPVPEILVKQKPSASFPNWKKTDSPSSNH